MYTTTDTARPGGFRATLRRGEAWLDAKGKWAWIAVMVLGFIVNPLVGLGVLAYLIWGKQMFSRSCGQRRQHDQHHAWGRHAMRSGNTTGNRAFDDYKAQALRRLEDEQEAFEAFLQRLRTSKDKTEFDSFMEDRARATAAQDASDTGETNTGETNTGKTNIGEAKPGATPGARPGEY